MTINRPTRRLTAVLSALLGLAAAAALLLTVVAPDSRADANPNSYDCQGHLEAGKALPGDDEDTTVAYKFACNGPITGYQIAPQLSDTGFDTSPVVTDKTGAGVPTDSFTCNGDFPGYGINCVGAYTGDYNTVSGSFTIAEKLCAEPRVDALLTVVYATADAKGKVTQAISGPYDLGRPHGCPKSKFGGKTRIPAE